MEPHMNRNASLVHVAAAFAWRAAPAHANTPAEGVKCPAGTTASIQGFDRRTRRQR